MKKNQKNDGELLMLCGALHDIAELVSQENVRSHIKTVQEKLEKIAVANMPKPNPQIPTSAN